MRSVNLILLAIANAAALNSQSRLFGSFSKLELPTSCGVPSQPISELKAVQEKTEAILDTKLSALQKRGVPAEFVQSVNTYVHIIEGSGAIPIEDADIVAQISLINSHLQFSNPDLNFKITLNLKSIDRTNNINWLNLNLGSMEEYDMKSTLRKATGPNELDIYFTSLAFYGGWATFPWWYQGNPQYDGIVSHSYSLPNQPWPRNGYLSIHEFGHWAGLLHTFEGGCFGGDFVEDTPFVASADENYFCPNSDSCPNDGQGPDDVSNHMDYGTYTCADHFTPLQYARMRDQMITYRGFLLPPSTGKVQLFASMNGRNKVNGDFTVKKTNSEATRVLLKMRRLPVDKNADPNNSDSGFYYYIGIMRQRTSGETNYQRDCDLFSADNHNVEHLILAKFRPNSKGDVNIRGDIDSVFAALPVSSLAQFDQRDVAIIKKNEVNVADSLAACGKFVVKK